MGLERYLSRVVRCACDGCVWNPAEWLEYLVSWWLLEVYFHMVGWELGVCCQGEVLVLWASIV